MNTESAALVWPTPATDLGTSAYLPRILLIDDDVVFGRTMVRLARRYDLSLTYVATTEDFLCGSSRRFDVAIVDYDLVTVTGVEVAEHLEKYAWLTSVVLTSSTFRRETPEEPWPLSVKGFVHKAAGATAILAAALASRGREALP